MLIICVGKYEVRDIVIASVTVIVILFRDSWLSFYFLIGRIIELYVERTLFVQNSLHQLCKQI